MELMYPIVIVVCLVVSIVIALIKFKTNKYNQGKRVANTKYIKETTYFKEKVKKYKVLSNIIKVLSILCIVCASVLVARPITIQSKSEKKYNRDIILGLDISTSECEVNLELVKQFEQIIPNIAGDRIGIVIFNTAPIVYCPLTDDYKYVNECLKKIEKQLNIVVKNNGNVPFTGLGDEEGMETQLFWSGGVLANNEEKGSSLVGDGLARNTIFISRFKN